MNEHKTNHRLERTRLRWAIVAGVAVVALTTKAPAQCAGDCNGDGGVSVNESVAATRVALEQPETCTSADRDGNGVTIDEIVAAVRLATCPVSTTAIPSPTPTPTPTQGVTVTPTIDLSACGDGSVDATIGETCDDGNTVDGDRCPANCRIAPCAVNLTTSFQVDVRFSVPPPAEVIGIETFIRYPDGVVAIRGTAMDNNVFDALSEQPDNAVLQPNDIEYGLVLIAYSFDSSTIAPGQLASIRFNPCNGARPPQASDFNCSVKSAGNAGGMNVDGVTCSAALR